MVKKAYDTLASGEEVSWVKRALIMAIARAATAVGAWIKEHTKHGRSKLRKNHRRYTPAVTERRKR